MPVLCCSILVKEFGQVDAGAGWAGLHDAAFGLVGHSLLPVAFLESYEDPNIPAIWHLITGLRAHQTLFTWN